ncbi:MAG: hypothetical protein HW380_3430 [Magnetococcales bacterium]|nr:hypothetical protein [Magnetococcales bacterium]
MKTSGAAGVMKHEIHFDGKIPVPSDWLIRPEFG